MQQINYWLAPDDPWLTRDAVKLLEQLTRNTDTGLEWGSGRSTAWFAARCTSLTSVENDVGWYAIVQQKLARNGLTNVTYELFDRSADEIERVGDVSDYVRVAGRFADSTLDFALVDGWARAACALAVLTKLRSAGLLILDNANWFLPPPADFRRAPNSRKAAEGVPSIAWQQFLDATALWRRIWTSDGVTNTLLLIKS